MNLKETQEALVLVEYNANVEFIQDDDGDILMANTSGLKRLIGGELEVLMPFDEIDAYNAITIVVSYIVGNELAVFDGLLVEDAVRVTGSDTWENITLKKVKYNDEYYYRIIYPKDCFANENAYYLQFQEF